MRPDTGTQAELTGFGTNWRSAFPWVLVNLKYMVLSNGRNRAGLKTPLSFQSPAISRSRDSEKEEGIRIPLRVGVSEVHEPGRLPVQSDRLDTVTVEIADERRVPRITEHIGEFSGTESSLSLPSALMM